MFKTTRTMWVGVALLLFSCACPEKHVEGPAPAEKAAEPVNMPPPAAEPAVTPPAPGEVQPATPATPPASPADPKPSAQATPPAAPAPAPAPPVAAATLPSKAGMPCDEKGCGGGYECKSYFGIAGPKGPEFKSCEIPCSAKSAKCPAGTKCTNIADGPGQVCR
jgi:hypothetical protein